MAAGLPTSLTLLARARDREPEAWRKLVFLYEPLVLTWARFWGLAGADSDDLAQEVFAAVATGLASFRHDEPGSSFRGWLKGVARHKLVDLRRKAGRSPKGQGGTDAQIALAGVAEPDLPEDTSADLSALYRRVLELVRGEFEPKSWQAFWRVAIDGQSTGVVAAELGMSTAAIRMVKSRVLRRLREEVGDVVELSGE